MGRVGQGQLGGHDDLRAQALQLRFHHRGAEHEHAAVPEIVTLGQVALGGRQVRLFDKGLDMRRAVDRRRLSADIAVAGFRFGGHHPEGDDLAFVDFRLGRRQGCVEGIGIADDMVCRQHQQDRIIPVRQRRERRGRNGRGGIAGSGFQEDFLRDQIQRTTLFGHDEPMFFVTYNDRRADALALDGQVLDSLQRGLKQTQVTVQGNKLLGFKCSGKRPQARA